MAPPKPIYIHLFCETVYIHGACQSNLYTSIPPLSIPGTVLFFPHLIPIQVLNLKRKNPHRPPLGVLPNLMPKKKLPTKKNSPVNTTFFIRKNACPLTKKNSAIYHTLQQGGGASWHRRICMRLKQNKIIRLGVLLLRP